MVGALFYMFWFRFIPEIFSAFSVAFLCGRAFVCFSARLAVHNSTVYNIRFQGVLQRQRQRVRWLCKRAL